MEKKDLDYFKEKLLAEKEKLEKELSTVGRINPDNPNDWEPIPGDVNQREADPNKLADKTEEYETNTAILKQLEIQHTDVLDALKKIEENDGEKYGICEDTGKEIPRGRLEANPSARKCEI
jgi:RNA polymerase-binding transcription factor DksA